MSKANRGVNRLLEILEDVRDECSKFGAIAEIKVPRPVGGHRQQAGVGKIFVKFEEVESCTKALKALAGRKFADRTVVTTYYPEVCFYSRPHIVLTTPSPESR